MIQGDAQSYIKEGRAILCDETNVEWKLASVKEAMLEIYDNLMLNPQAERAMEYFYMEKNYAAFYAELDVLVGAPEGEFS